MPRKGPKKPYWEMTTEELAEATKEFDKEFVADTFKPLSAKNRARWEKMRAKLSKPESTQLIVVRVDRELLARAMKIARKKRINRDALITRGLKAVLAATGEM